MRDEHHDHPEKANDDRRPAIDAHALFQNDSGKRDRNERRGERDRCCVSERQSGQRREIAEHAADAERPAPKLAERPARAHCRGQLAAKRIDDHDRNDREGAAEKHHLADRRNVAQQAHQGGHCRKQQRRNHFETDCFEGIHGRADDSPYITTIVGNIRVYFPEAEPPAAGNDLI